MYSYSMSIACVFTTYLGFVASYTLYLPLYLLCFRAEDVTNQQDDVMNCVFGHVTRFWPSSKRYQILNFENWQIQTVVTSRCFIRNLSNFQFRVLE